MGPAGGGAAFASGGSSTAADETATATNDLTGAANDLVAHVLRAYGSPLPTAAASPVQIGGDWSWPAALHDMDRRIENRADWSWPAALKDMERGQEIKDRRQNTAPWYGDPPMKHRPSNGVRTTYSMFT
jgi:hypothetical protein